MPINENPANLRQQARAIASGAKSARAAWSELRSWAAGKGPLAMKSAAEEFLTIHGRNPESAAIMPEVMQSASWGMSPAQRHDVLLGARQWPALARPSPQLQPRSATEMLPLTMFFRPKPKTGSAQLGTVIPLESPTDPIYLKDAELRMRGASMTAIPKPALGQRSQKTFDASRSPDSFGKGVQPVQGSELMHQLVERMRAHGRDEFISSHSISIRDLPAPKPRPPKAAALESSVRSARRKTRKRVVRPAKKAKPAKTRKIAKTNRTKPTRAKTRIKATKTAKTVKIQNPKHKTKRLARVRGIRKAAVRRKASRPKARRTMRKPKRSRR